MQIVKRLAEGCENSIAEALPNEEVLQLFQSWVRQGEYGEFGVSVLLRTKCLTLSDLQSGFRVAAQEGHVSIVRELHKIVGDAVCDEESAAIRLAALDGRFDVVRFLLTVPCIDPTVFGNEALLWAEDNEHNDIADLLRADPRVAATLAEHPAEAQFVPPAPPARIPALAPPAPIPALAPPALAPPAPIPALA